MGFSAQVGALLGYGPGVFGQGGRGVEIVPGHGVGQLNDFVRQLETVAQAHHTG